MNDADHDFDYPTGTHGRIPSFNSVEEEAAFWDTHDFTDYLDEATSVRVIQRSGLGDRLSLRLAPTDREALTRLAHERGVGPSTLVRIWIKERLRQEAPTG